jgi:hypothetical protein
MKQVSDQPPFSRRVAATEVPPEGLDLTIRANEAECAALAAAYGLVALPKFEAQLRITRFRGDGLSVAGELRATTRQACVVTLEEFDSDLVEPILARFIPPKEPPRPTRARRHDRQDRAPVVESAPSHDINPIEDDPPEQMIGGGVDVGALAAEFLALALDPYPRRPGASFAEPAPAEEASDLSASPFAKLRAGGGKGEDGSGSASEK